MTPNSLGLGCPKRHKHGSRAVQGNNKPIFPGGFLEGSHPENLWPTPSPSLHYPARSSLTNQSEFKQTSFSNIETSFDCDSSLPTEPYVWEPSNCTFPPTTLPWMEGTLTLWHAAALTWLDGHMKGLVIDLKSWTIMYTRRTGVCSRRNEDKTLEWRHWINWALLLVLMLCSVSCYCRQIISTFFQMIANFQPREDA